MARTEHPVTKLPITDAECCRTEGVFSRSKNAGRRKATYADRAWLCGWMLKRNLKFSTLSQPSVI